MGNPAKGAVGKGRRPSRLAKGHPGLEERWVVRGLHDEGHRPRRPSSPLDAWPESRRSVSPGLPVEVGSVSGTVGGCRVDPVVEGGIPETAELESSPTERDRGGGEDEVERAVGYHKGLKAWEESVDSAAGEQNADGTYPGEVVDSTRDSVSGPASLGQIAQGYGSGNSFEKDLNEAAGRLEELSLMGKEPALEEEQRRSNEQRQEDEVSDLT